MTAGLPVAKTWFVTDSIDGDLDLIREPYVDPFLRANIWHIRGRDHDLVVDAGLGVTLLRPLLPKLFAHNPLLVITHAHLDHMGSAHEFPDRAAHHLERTGSPLRGTLNTAEMLRSIGYRASSAESLPERVITALPHADYDPETYVLQPVEVTRELDDLDVIDLGDRKFVVLHLPGHSPGSIALYDEDRGMLFSGDVLYEGELLDRIDGSDVGDYLDSMARLRELPVTVVHPGHGNSFDGDRMRELIDDYVRSRTTHPAS